MHVKHSLPPFMSIELFQEKSKEGVGWWYIYISEKTLGIYIFVTLPLENKLSALEIWKFEENRHDFFWITPRKSISFLIDSGIYAYFFQ